MDALVKGHFYFSIDLLGDPTGFYFLGKEGRQEHILGDRIRLEKNPIKLVADLGRDIETPHEIQLLKDGEIVMTSSGKGLTYITNQKGAYRVVVKLLASLPLPDGKIWFPWIFSNSIRLE